MTLLSVRILLLKTIFFIAISPAESLDSKFQKTLIVIQWLITFIWNIFRNDFSAHSVFLPKKKRIFLFKYLLIISSRSLVRVDYKTTTTEIEWFQCHFLVCHRNCIYFEDKSYNLIDSEDKYISYIFL